MKIIQIGRKIIKLNSSKNILRNFSFEKMLLPHHTIIVEEEIEMLQKLQVIINKIDNNSTEHSLIKDTLSGIHDLFMIVVVGEFNSGKSTFINSILGGEYLKTGVLPTTSKICVLRYSDNTIRTWKATENLLLKDFDEISLPVDWLKHIAIIDTPGTNAIYSHHEKITTQVIPRSDLIIFVTSVERPITESEASFLRKICEWGKKIIVVVNKIDTVSPREREEILSYVSQHCSSIIGVSYPIPVFGLSSRVGLQAKLKGKILPSSSSSSLSSNTNSSSINSWDNGNLDVLEKYLFNSLSQKQILQLKLDNPLQIADRIILHNENILHEREEMLNGDLQVLGFIEENMVVFHSDIEREIQLFKQQIHNILNKLRQRGENFLDENISILKPQYLYNKKALEKAFTQDVIIDIISPIDDIIQDMCNFISKRSNSQAKAVGLYVGSRPSRYSSSTIGQIHKFDETQTNLFYNTRETLLDRLRRDTSEIILSSNYSKESTEISSVIQSSVQQIALFQSISGITLGALFFANIIDITGIVAGTGFVASTLLLLPHRKKIVKY